MKTKQTQDKLKVGNITYYTMAGLLKILPVTERTLYRYIENGKLKGQRLGWLWIFEEKEVKKLITKSKKKTKRFGVGGERGRGK